MRILFLVLPLLAGCSMVKELHRGPYPYAVTHHSRVVGIETQVPNQAGDAVFKMRLGFFSDTLTLIPCSTNELHIPPIADAFRLGQSGLDTSITEDITTGWHGTPPTPRVNMARGKAFPCPPSVTQSKPPTEPAVTNAVASKGLAIWFENPPTGPTFDAMVTANIKPTDNPLVWRLDKYDFSDPDQANALHAALAERAVFTHP